MRRMKKVAAATLTAIMVASIAMGTTESWARSSTRAAWNNAAAQSKDEEQIVNDACYAEDGSVTEERNVKSNVYANSEEWPVWEKDGLWSVMCSAEDLDEAAELALYAMLDFLRRRTGE